jgi:hypothetical protein
LIVLSDLSTRFSSDSVKDKMTVDGCIAAVSTISSGLNDVRVHFTVVDARPPTILEAWDHITEISITINSGAFIVADSLFRPEAIIPVSPDVYRLRAHHRDLAIILAAYYAGDTSAIEEIWITAWQEAHGESLVLKRFP